MKAIKDGYIIDHKAILCSLPTPPADLVLSLRVLVLDLEAMFTARLWALYGDGIYGVPENVVSMGTGDTRVQGPLRPFVDPRGASGKFHADC